MEYRGYQPPPSEQDLTGREKAPDEIPTVPENEIELDFVRSSGPGGQNVNKTSTKAQLRWNVGLSPTFTEEQKAIIRAYAGKRLNKEDEIVLEAQNERSQPQNRDEVIRRLQSLVAEALTPKTERIVTKVSRSQKERRLEEKRREGDKKKNRRTGRDEW